MSTANAKWMYDYSKIGDVVVYKNSPRPLEFGNGVHRLGAELGEVVGGHRRQADGRHPRRRLVTRRVAGGLRRVVGGHLGLGVAVRQRVGLGAARVPERHPGRADGIAGRARPQPLRSPTPRVNPLR